MCQAVRLARQCVEFAHCTFGCGFGGLLLAYVLANGGKTYKVMNGCGLGGPLSDLPCLSPPPPRGECDVPAACHVTTWLCVCSPSTARVWDPVWCVAVQTARCFSTNDLVTCLRTGRTVVCGRRG